MKLKPVDFINYKHATKWAKNKAVGPCSVRTRFAGTYVLVAFLDGKKHLVSTYLVRRRDIARSIALMSNRETI